MFAADKSFYVIEGLEPASYAVNKYNFSIGLDIDFARRAFETEMPEGGEASMNEIGIGIMKEVGLLRPDSEYTRPVYRFLENDKRDFTLLLSHINIPGASCSLDVTGDDINDMKGRDLSKRFIGYHPHNIESIYQAYTLLSLWLRWARVTEATLRNKD